MTTRRAYISELRRQQAKETRDRLLDAAGALIEERGLEAASNRAIAERAQVTEMTLYRHFPTRDGLLGAVWRRRNAAQGVRGGFPGSLEALVAQLPELFASFDATPAHIVGALTTPQGRALRASQDEARRTAFLALLDDSLDLPPEARREAASVLQLLYSAYAWLSLREQWGLEGAQAARAVAWAAQVLISDLRRHGGGPRSASEPPKDVCP